MPCRNLFVTFRIENFHLPRSTFHIAKFFEPGNQWNFSKIWCLFSVKFSMWNVTLWWSLVVADVSFDSVIIPDEKSQAKHLKQVHFHNWILASDMRKYFYIPKVTFHIPKVTFQKPANQKILHSTFHIPKFFEPANQWTTYFYRASLRMKVHFSRRGCY